MRLADEPAAGDELTAFLSRYAEFDRVIYIGDGDNDFCPVLRLRRLVVFENILSIAILHFPCSQDMVLCRKCRGLEKRIMKDGEKEGLRCQVKYWSDAWEVEEIFGKLRSQSAN